MTSKNGSKQKEVGEERNAGRRTGGHYRKMPDTISSTGRCRTLQKGVIPSCLPLHTL